MKNKRNTIIGVLLLLVVMTIGYALFSETVTIGSTAKGEGNLSIIFTNPSTGGNNIKVTEHGSHGATATIEQNGKKLDIQIPNMEYPSSYVEIPVRIKNNGSIKGYVKKITPDKLDTTDIKVTYTPMKDYYMLNPGDVKDLLIKVEWDIDSTSKATTGFSIIIDYEQAVTTDTEPNYTPKYYAVGEVVSIGNQQFNVIKDNGDSITMLAKYNLDLDGLIQTSPKDKYNVYSVKFAEQKQDKKPSSSFGYWTDDNGDLLLKYGTVTIDEYGTYENSINVYDSNSNTYKIVEAYVDKLKGIKKIPQNDKNTLTGRLIYMSELVELGYPSDGGYCTNEKNKTWLDNEQNWWSGSVGGYYAVHNVSAYGYFGGSRFWDTVYGVRPVITIKKAYL